MATTHFEINNLIDAGGDTFEVETVVWRQLILK